MLADDRVDAFERAVGDHRGRAGAGARFLGGLEQEPHRAAKFVPVLLHHLNDAGEDGRVGVVPAGVHDARAFGRDVVGRILGDGQRVDVGADHQRRSGLSPLDLGDEAALSALESFFDHGNAEFRHPGGDFFRRLHLAPGKFRVTVKLAAQGHGRFGSACDAVLPVCHHKRPLSNRLN